MPADAVAHQSIILVHPDVAAFKAFLYAVILVPKEGDFDLAMRTADDISHLSQQSLQAETGQNVAQVEINKSCFHSDYGNEKAETVNECRWLR